MKKEDVKIIFMGTPEFAVESLRTLVEAGYRVVAVVTVPDKPVGRHQTELTASPVKQYAAAAGIPVLQPVKLKDEAFVEELRSYNADLQIVVAFRMLPEVVWAMPPLGTFNLHASILPQYRGAAPINWPIINGDTETGASTFFLTHEIDTGHVIGSFRIPIADTDTAGTIHDSLMTRGSRLVVETVEAIISGNISPTPQASLMPGEELRPAPKLFKDNCRIDWSLDTKRTYDFVRGLSPYPGAWTELHSGQKATTMKIFAAEKVITTPTHPIGTITTDGKTHIDIATPDGYLRITNLQISGKKRMTAQALLNGYKFAEGDRVE